MRVAGFDIPDSKRVEIALTYIYGVGRSNIYQILREAGIDPNIRVKDLTGAELSRIQKALEKIPVGGDLRQMVRENIQRLKEIKCYRGIRHMRNLPVRGQRTRSNARTKRGKRKTVGAIRKDIALRMARAQKEKEQK